MNSSKVQENIQTVQCLENELENEINKNILFQVNCQKPFSFNTGTKDKHKRLRLAAQGQMYEQHEASDGAISSSNQSRLHRTKRH
jgi:hypothetical protein